MLPASGEMVAALSSSLFPPKNRLFAQMQDCKTSHTCLLINLYSTMQLYSTTLDKVTNAFMPLRRDKQHALSLVFP